MSNFLSTFFTEFCDAVGSSWNRFWFSSRSVTQLAGLRIIFGAASFYYVASHSADLLRWFQTDGLLPVTAVRQLTANVSSPWTVPPLNVLNYAASAGELWFMHILALLVIAAFTAGLFTRVTSVLTLCAVLSYVHRAPMIAGQFESILTMFLFYLCFSPCGATLGFDAWRKNRNRTSNNPAGSTPPSSWVANLCIRLMQVHLAAFYVIMALTKLGGVYDLPMEAIWWRGEGLWWLIARSECRLIDLTGLHEAPLVIHFWTHAVLLFELLFPILIWNRWARPLLLVVAIPIWCSLALTSGLVSYCLLMIFANLVFVSSAVLDRLCARRTSVPAHTARG